MEFFDPKNPPIRFVKQEAGRYTSTGGRYEIWKTTHRGQMWGKSPTQKGA